KALAWLSADLALRKKQAASAVAAERKTAVAELSHWLADTDLSGLRDTKALESLPAGEQKKWQQVRADAKATLAGNSRLPRKSNPTGGQGFPLNPMDSHRVNSYHGHGCACTLNQGS